MYNFFSNRDFWDFSLIYDNQCNVDIVTASLFKSSLFFIKLRLKTNNSFNKKAIFHTANQENNF